MIGKVLIVGGGICGMSCAIALAKGGWTVDLVDIDPEWRALGAGLTVGGPALRAFKSLGVVDDVREQGYFAREAKVVDHAGEVLNTAQMPIIGDGLPAVAGIMRPTLHAILASHVRANGVNVRLGVTVEDFTDSAAGVEVTTSDGQTAQYDLMLGADSLNSRIRARLFPENEGPVFTGQGCWRLVAPLPKGVLGPVGYASGPYPIGFNPISADAMYMYLLMPDPDRRFIPEDTQIAVLREMMQGFGGMAGDVAAAMDETYLVNYRPLQKFLLEGPWFKGNVLLVGDAAHGTTPHLGFGAGLAIEDAVVLGDELSKASTTGEAFSRFMERRFDRAKFVVETSVHMGELELAGRRRDGMNLQIEALSRLMEPI